MNELKTEHLNGEYISQHRDYRGAGMTAVIIYDQCDLALKANAMLERAALSVDDFQWDVRPFCLQHVLSFAEDDLPMVEAVEADLIVIAVRNSGSLSQRLMDWLEMWAKCRSVERAGLAVFDGSNGDMLALPIACSLVQFANRHGLCLVGADGCVAINDRPASHMV